MKYTKREQRAMAEKQAPKKERAKMKKFFFRLKVLWRLKSLKQMLKVLENRKETMNPFEYQYEHGFLVDVIKRLEDGDIGVFEELKIFGYK